jgi:hypothetical protein
MPPSNSNESYCTFTLASDVTAGGLPSEADIAKDLESSDANVREEETNKQCVWGGDHQIIVFDGHSFFSS